MPVQCLKRPCAIFDEFEPVRKIRLLDHIVSKTGIDLRLSLSEDTTVPRQATCLVVPPKRKRQLQPDDDAHRQFSFPSSRKKAKMVIQALDSTSVENCGGGVCFDSSDRPSLAVRQSDADGIICAKSSPAMVRCRK